MTDRRAIYRLLVDALRSRFPALAAEPVVHVVLDEISAAGLTIRQARSHVRLDELEAPQDVRLYIWSDGDRAFAHCSKAVAQAISTYLVREGRRSIQLPVRPRMPDILLAPETREDVIHKIVERVILLTPVRFSSRRGWGDAVWARFASDEDRDHYLAAYPNLKVEV